MAMLALALGALRGRLRRYAIAEHSMTPTLSPDDWVLALRLDGIPRRGDVVVVPSPLEPGMELVKRVVGLPGERVSLADGRVHIDDAVLAEPWADGPTPGEGDWLLEEGEVFLLGDARSRSTADSRTLGPIPAASAGWRIAARYWPPGAMGRI